MKLTLETALRHLAIGELQNLSMCDDTGGMIREDQIPRITEALNESLMRIYSIFPVREDSLVLLLEVGKYTYELTKENAFSNGGKYIQDNEYKKFKGNILTITEVRDTSGNKLKINEDSIEDSVFTPTATTIQVTHPEMHRALSISFRCLPERFDLEDLGSEVEVPDALLGAMYAYAAYLVYSSVGGEGGTASAQAYFALYQDVVEGVKIYGVLQYDPYDSANRFEHGGWI